MKPTKKLKKADVLEFDNRKDNRRGNESHSLTLKIDNLKTFQPLTNIKDFSLILIKAELTS